MYIIGRFVVKMSQRPANDALSHLSHLSQSQKDRIISLRQKHRLPLREVAHLVGTSKDTVRRFELATLPHEGSTTTTTTTTSETIEVHTDNVIERDSKLYTLVTDSNLLDHFNWWAVTRYSPSLVYPFKGRMYVLNDALHDSNTVDIDRCPACKMFSQESCGLGSDPLDYGTRYEHSHKYSFRHGSDTYVQGRKVQLTEDGKSYYREPEDQEQLISHGMNTLNLNLG